MEGKRVVITGVGPLTPIGTGKENLWKALLEAKTNIKLEEYKVDTEVWGKFYLHRIEDFDIKNFGIEAMRLEEIKQWKDGEEVIDLYYLLAGVKLALEDSRLEYDPEENNIACVISHENPGLEQYFSRFISVSFDCYTKEKILGKKEFFKKLYSKLYKSSYELQTFMTLYHITKTFNLHGYSLFINNACASGLYALEVASQIIKSGRSPAVIVATGDHPRVYKYLWFKELKMYAEDGKIRPFAKEAKGFVFGDGAVGLVLEDFNYALKRKARIYAEYLGGGFSQEAWKVILPAVGSRYYQKAIQEAINFSKINKGDIDLLCVHGAGNPLIDRYEARAITEIFGIKPKKPLITVFKPYVGHNLGGDALMETAILLFCLEHNLVLPVLNTQRVDERTKIELVKERINVELKLALKTCCAFAGYNGAIVLRKV